MVPTEAPPTGDFVKGLKDYLKSEECKESLCKAIPEFITFFNNARKWFQSLDGRLICSCLSFQNKEFADIVGNNFNIFNIDDRQYINPERMATHTIMSLLKFKKFEGSDEKVDIGDMWEAMNKTTRWSGSQPAWIEAAYKCISGGLDISENRPLEESRRGRSYLRKIIANNKKREIKIKNRVKLVLQNDEDESTAIEQIARYVPDNCSCNMLSTPSLDQYAPATPLSLEESRLIKDLINDIITTKLVSGNRMAKLLNIDRSFLRSIKKGVRKFPRSKISNLQKMIKGLPEKSRIELLGKNQS